MGSPVDRFQCQTAGAGGGATVVDAGRSAVHCAHLRALMGMTDRQYGHSLVVGSDGAGVPPTFFITDPSSFTMVMNTANAISRKLSNSATKLPMRMRPMVQSNDTGFCSAGAGAGAGGGDAGAGGGVAAAACVVGWVVLSGPVAALCAICVAVLTAVSAPVVM